MNDRRRLRTADNVNFLTAHSYTMADEYGDDDFEDYEDEFEDDAEEEAPTAADAQKVIAEADSEMRARLAEAGATRVGGAKMPPAAVAAAPTKQPPEKFHFIAPPTHEERELQKLKGARLVALQGVRAQLSEVDAVLYDAPPLSEYELHLRQQGRATR